MRPIRFKRGRVFGEVVPSSINLPRLHVLVDGETLCTVGFSYGNGSSDPVVLVDVNLDGTRLGRLLAAAYWIVRDLIEKAKR